jgi:hypothetical protein
MNDATIGMDAATKAKVWETHWTCFQKQSETSPVPIFIKSNIPGIWYTRYRLYLTIPELKLAKSPKVEQKIEVLSCRRLVSQNIPSSNIDAVDCCDPHNRSNHKANQHRE